MNVDHLETPMVTSMIRGELSKIIEIYEKTRATFQAQTDQKELRFAELRKELIADELNLDAYTVFIERLKAQRDAMQITIPING